MIIKNLFTAVNQIAVAQNAADSASPLDCTPECPQVSKPGFLVNNEFSESDIRALLSIV